jgi:predicted MPP superfamily phosphohydrolase
MLADSDIIDLSNRHITLQRGAASLSIAGVDDVLEEQDDLNTVLHNLPQSGAAIVLAHEPEFADESAAAQRFDLQLSGHSHGGQIRLPFLGPLFLPKLGEKYHTGLYQIGGMWQYTNRGIGMVKLKARFNCRPEITLLTLHPVSDYPDWITT